MPEQAHLDLTDVLMAHVSCDGRLDVDRRDGGLMVECHGCGAVVRVPLGAASGGVSRLALPAPTPALGPDAVVAIPAPAVKRAPRTVPPSVLLGVVLCAVGALAAVAILVGGGDEESSAETSREALGEVVSKPVPEPEPESEEREPAPGGKEPPAGEKPGRSKGERPAGRGKDSRAPQPANLGVLEVVPGIGVGLPAGWRRANAGESGARFRPDEGGAEVRLFYERGAGLAPDRFAALAGNYLEGRGVRLAGRPSMTGGTGVVQGRRGAERWSVRTSVLDGYWLMVVTRTERNAAPAITREAAFVARSFEPIG